MADSFSPDKSERLLAIATYMEQLENFDDATFLRSIASAEPQRAAALDDIERRIVAMIRYVSMKAGVAETTYGAMCHEARCILRNAHLDYDALSAVSSGAARPGILPDCDKEQDR